VLVGAVAEIVRVTGLPVSTDMEAGYSDEPPRVAAVVEALIDAGSVGINLEDASAPPDLMVAKIAAVKRAAQRSGVDLFVNARTDVYLRRLVPAERALEETIARARRYQQAGADGIFVPGVGEREAIRTIAQSIELPLNVLVLPNLPPVAELRELGVRRVSAGSAVSAAAYGAARRSATRFLKEGLYDAFFSEPVAYAGMNELFPKRSR
jgi:2-methylisocitrate lyase-like PEP mutase family enzyme